MIAVKFGPQGNRAAVLETVPNFLLSVAFLDQVLDLDRVQRVPDGYVVSG